ncbi:hypothetical protein NMQ14_17645 [Methyloversatilis sp. XJ19-13]|uniref:hypothetical protein n=1 Tax=Methyloversatilis sp. XJ19-13 TaxID=2963430 RepID=UPI00211BB8CF|nr:hypothetical protein [Methyloversatilis sp. XJ19-13]MCQ9376075.1 hypothetical protein [Methyloversatilis sp. XJ19-13]
MTRTPFDKRSLAGLTRNPVNAAAPSAGVAPAAVPPVLRMVVGLDAAPVPLTAPDLAALSDPFALLILRRDERPMTVDALLERLDILSAAAALADAAVPEEQVFLVGEGGQIPFTPVTASLNRELRFVVARTGASGRLILLSVDDRPSANTGLLQVLSWDPSKGAYNFYQRRDDVWFYSGDGTHALEPPTRGRGPFDGHVNGSLVMKELRAPWLHWNSQSVLIPPEAFAPGHPILGHRLMTHSQGAEILERDIVQPGIDRWTEARFDRSIQAGTLSAADTFLRQLVQTTSVNLVASDREFRELAAGVKVNVPPEILLNVEAWSRLLDPQTIRGRIQVDGGHLLQAIDDLGIALEDPAADFRQIGEAFFVLACPSPAFEDLSIIFALIDRGVLSLGLVRAILAVDFSNPIQSSRRAGLQRHMPKSGALGTGAASCEALILDAFAAEAVARPDSDEAQVLDWIATGDDAAQRARIGAQIAAYYEAAKRRLQTEQGVRDLMRLVVSRRRYFRTLGVSEFALTLPVDSLLPDAAPVMMAPDATIFEVPDLIASRIGG